MSTYTIPQVSQAEQKISLTLLQTRTLWDQNSQTNRLHRSSKHLATSVHSTDFLIAPPIIVYAMNSRIQGQNLLSRFIFHLPVLCTFILCHSSFLYTEKENFHVSKTQKIYLVWSDKFVFYVNRERSQMKWSLIK